MNRKPSPSVNPNLIAAGRMAGLSQRTADLLQQAGRAIDHNDPEAINRALTAAVALAPTHPEVLRVLGVAYLVVHRPGDAVATLVRALAQRPDDALILNNLGCAQRDNGDPDTALATLREACKRAPQLASAWYNLGKTLIPQGRFEDACDAFERALQIQPAHIDARIAYGNTLKALGKIDQAGDEYRAVLQDKPANGNAWIGLANLKTVRFTAEETSQIQHAYDQPGHDDEAIAMIGFALAKALEDQQRYADAFAVLVGANAARRRSVPWDAQLFSRGIPEIVNAYSEASTTGDSQRGKEAIFVLSLPRSGSTLIEQIVSTHPEVEGAGELPDLCNVLEEESRRRGQPFLAWMADATESDWERLGTTYLQRTARWRHTRPRFTDKALPNWRVVGAAVRMLPGARFVDCRRDPLETCFSCYRQWFADGQGFSYDLDATVAYWRDYQRLMRHWHALFPSRIHLQVYEDLLAEPEAQIRRLLDACGLPFDAACLEFHRNPRAVRTASAAQVREPLRRDTGRAERYGALLDPLRRALAEPL